MGAEQPPQARRIGDAGQVEVRARAGGRGGPGHVGIAAAGRDRVIAAQRAGIAKGTVYLYFASRSDLLTALRSRYALSLADRTESILEHADPADPGSVTGAFDRLAAELLDYVHANRRLYHVLFHEAPGHQEQAMDPLRHLIGRVRWCRGGVRCRAGTPR